MTNIVPYKGLEADARVGNQKRAGRALGLALAVLLVISCGIISNPTQPVPTATATAIPSATPTLTPAPTPTPVTPSLSASAVPSPTPAPIAPAAPIYLQVIGAICTTNKPAKPTMFVNQFHLAWQDVSNNEDGFRVYRDGDRVAELPTDKTDVIDEVIARNNRTHYYYVTAYNAVGESKSEVIALTCEGAGAGGGGGGGGGFGP